MQLRLSSTLESAFARYLSTRSGPKIPAAGLFGGRLYFGFGESRDYSFGFELLDAFFANQNLLAEDEENIQIFSSKFF